MTADPYQILHQYDAAITGYAVIMPAVITLGEFDRWKNAFLQEISKRPDNEKFSLLVDTNQHNFETLAALKSFSDFFRTNDSLHAGLDRIAMAAPAAYAAPFDNTDRAAFCGSFSAAYDWLAEKG